jgi:hypothetical protein
VIQISKPDTFLPVYFGKLLASQVVSQKVLIRLFVEKRILLKEEFLEMVKRVNYDFKTVA